MNPIMLCSDTTLAKPDRAIANAFDPDSLRNLVGLLINKKKQID